MKLRHVAEALFLGSAVMTVVGVFVILGLGSELGSDTNVNDEATLDALSRRAASISARTQELEASMVDLHGGLLESIARLDAALEAYEAELELRRVEVRERRAR